MKININDNMYPSKLKDISKPPKQLYLEGNIKLLKKNCIAIIGSRNPTKYGENMARKFSKELGEYGIVVISGMAKGIDSIVHMENLENTIAVLPCGINNIYPNENKKLYDKIKENGGLIITEYDENQEANSERFIERNRIVSGLSDGVFIIEGGYRSGTSITAKLAKQQGKLLFCIPSSLENPKGYVPNKLIKEGAILVSQVEDIINKYPQWEFKKRKNKKYNADSNVIDDEYKSVYNVLNSELHINEICKKTKLGIDEVNYKLIMLELENKVISLPGNNYKRK